MYEIRHNSGRNIIYQYMSHSDCTELDVLNFQTTKIFDESGYQNALFDTLFSYFRLTKAPADLIKREIDFDIEEAIRFVCQGELFMIEGTQFLFRGDFTNGDDNPFTDNIEDINFKNCVLSIETGNYKSDFIIGYHYFDGAIERRRIIFGEERMRSDYKEIYQAIRNYSFKRTLSPEILLSHIKGKLL